MLTLIGEDTDQLIFDDKISVVRSFMKFLKGSNTERLNAI